MSTRDYILRTPSTSNDAAPAFVRKAMEWAKGANELHGIIKGVLADGQIAPAEADLVRSFISRSDLMTDPLVRMLAARIERVYADGVVSSEELAELREIFGDYLGGAEEKTPTPLPLNNPPPQVVFPRNVFCFTGTFVSGTRSWCHQRTETLGGITSGRVTTSGYLVIGSKVSAGWANQSYGRKIEAAVSARDSGLPVSIIAEDHWLKFLV